MNLPKTSEVIVIGGGLLGTSTAYQLAKTGVEVTVLERGELAQQASGTNWGFVWIQTQPVGEVLDRALASREMYQTLTDELGFDIEYEPCGGMVVLEREEDLAPAQALVTNQKEVGVDIRLIDGDEVRSMEPAFSSTIAGAVFSPLDGKVNPIYLNLGFAQAAKKHGAHVATGSEVRAIDVRRRQIQSVVTDKGKIQTRIVVNAAGVEAPKIGRMVGTDIPLVYHQGEVIATEPLPPLVSCLVYSGSCIRSDPRSREGEPSPLGPAGHHSADFGYVQHARGNIVLGIATGPRLGIQNSAQNWRAKMKPLTDWATRTIPALKTANVIRSWTGLKPAPVLQPPEGAIIDKIEFRDSCMVVVVDVGHGVACCPIDGKLAAELITQERNGMSLSLDKCRLIHYTSKSHRTS